MTPVNQVQGVATPLANAALDATVGMHATALARSDARFPDGAQMRVEIPSVENPTAMAAVIAAADAHAITVHRVSQGSGAMLLSESELREMSTMGADRGIEVSLFIGPREEFGVGGSVRSLEGRALSGHLRGLHQLRYALEDVLRALECGIRGFLIADPGLMEVLAAYVISSRPANADNPVMLPGDPERRIKEERLRSGVPVEETTLDLIRSTETAVLP